MRIALELSSTQQAILTLDGRLDAETAAALKEQSKQLVDTGHAHLIIDLSSVSFIDSSGLSALVSGLRATRQAGGSLKIVGLNEMTATAFRLTRLDRVFESYTDTASALSVAPSA